MLSLAHEKLFKLSSFETKLGLMSAIADETSLYVLDFADRADVKIKKLKALTKAGLISEDNDIICSLRDELYRYFEGKIRDFKTPICLLGTDFQKGVWKELQHIPYGMTRSYYDQACLAKNPTAYRAVANANAANPITVLIPCHRVIHKNGTLGGYNGGLTRKKWLLDHEKMVMGKSISI